MKAKLVLLFSVFLMLAAITIAALFSYFKYPSFVRDSLDILSSKLSYNYGLTECVADSSDKQWHLICSPKNQGATLDFIVKP